MTKLPILRARPIASRRVCATTYLILSPIKINPRFITVLQSILNCTIVSKVLNLALEPDYKLGCSTVPGTKNGKFKFEGRGGSNRPYGWYLKIRDFWSTDNSLISDLS